MITINATNAATVQNISLGAHKTFSHKSVAIANAIATLGPCARNEYEFKVWKCDGVWRWEMTDEVKPDSDQQRKINGGKRPVPTPQVPAMPGMTPFGMPGKLPAKPAYAPEPLPATNLPATPENAPAAPAPTGRMAQVFTDAQRLMLEDGAPAAMLRGPDTEDDKVRRAKVVANAAKPKIKNPPDAKKIKAIERKTKIKTVAYLLTRKEGCTMAEILATLGWKVVGVAQQAREAGIKKLKKTKMDGITRYYAD